MGVTSAKNLIINGILDLQVIINKFIGSLDMVSNTLSLTALAVIWCWRCDGYR
jgi:hypothetical protein